jgi:hypothetical protein
MTKFQREKWKAAETLETESRRLFYLDRFFESTSKLRESARKYEEAGDLGNAYRAYLRAARSEDGVMEDKAQYERLEKIIFG